jgi:hypothetical protein
MYVGVINRQVVFCCHPVLVIANSGVSGSFETEDDALRFMFRRGWPLGVVYRHDGMKWDRVPVDPSAAFERLCGFGSRAV